MKKPAMVIGLFITMAMVGLELLSQVPSPQLPHGGGSTHPRLAPRPAPGTGPGSNAGSAPRFVPIFDFTQVKLDAPRGGGVDLNPCLEIDFDAEHPAAAQYVIAKDIGFQRIVYDSGEQVNDLWSHLAFADLSRGRHYYWKARIKNSQGAWSPWSLAASFTTRSAAAYENVFQDGLMGYEGTADADLRGSFENPEVAIREWNQGLQDVLRTGRRLPGSMTDEIYRSLIRFDLTGLADPGAVVGAYLQLTGWEHGAYSGEFNGANALYELYRPWGEGGGLVEEFPIEGEVSWTYSAYPLTWGFPGAALASDTNPAADRAATPLLRKVVTNQPGYVTTWGGEKLLDLVRRWIADPASNHGVLLMAEDESIQLTLNLASREHSNPAYRPRLVVISLENAPFPEE